jgi:hypothetical protein
MPEKMPRPRKNDPSSLLNPIVEEFAQRLASTVEKFTIGRIEQAIKTQVNGLRGGRRGGRSASARGKREQILCYYPGCKNLAAPRFGMFCAKEHKNLSKAEKEKYRAAHKGGAKGAAAAGKRGRKKKAA